MAEIIDEREEARKSLFYGTNNKKHICETLRMIHDFVYEMEDSRIKREMTDLLIDAMMMAKKMHMRLVYYRDTYHDHTGSGGKFIGLTGVRRRAIRRKARPR